MLSNFAGIGQGFRDSNQWLAVLTNHLLPITFYAGDALGSFNSWARFVTGILAGLGIVWLEGQISGKMGEWPWSGGKQGGYVH